MDPNAEISAARLTGLARPDGHGLTKHGQHERRELRHSDHDDGMASPLAEREPSQGRGPDRISVDHHLDEGLGSSGHHRHSGAFQDPPRVEIGAGRAAAVAAARRGTTERARLSARATSPVAPVNVESIRTT